MNTRALALLLVAATATPALAAPKQVCQLVTDAAGDAKPADNLPSRDGIDILSADLATGRNNLVAVIRLASVTLDPTLAPGTAYRFQWRAGGVGQEATATHFADGSWLATFDATSGSTGGEVTTVRFVVDTATKSLVWTIPRKWVAQLGKKGTRFSSFRVLANQGVNVSLEPTAQVTSRVDTGNGDVAESSRSYTDLALSCVKGV